MTFGIILFFLASVFVLFVLFKQYKKNEFNSIEVGDEIFYSQDTLCDECCGVLGSDIVTKIEYYEDGENIKFVYTEKGEKYNFLDYMRDNFILSN